PNARAWTHWRWVSAGDGDLVITDVVMPDENVFDILPQIRKKRPTMPVIVMSAQNNLMTAVNAAEQGAYEYVPKPFDLNELVSIVRRALGSLKERAIPATLPAEVEEPPEKSDKMPLIGRSAAMQDIYRVMARLMQTDLTVMISGESGTGKELVARALHDFGKRRGKPFIAVNMAAIPRELIESELFGHEKGSFTGANQRLTGRFEQAAGGTLFLDEIGDMPLEAQTRLLRVLQEGEFSTVGGRSSIKTDVRIIAATNKDLLALVEQGLFREDLFFRLNVVPVRLPPLRERSDDIPDLVRHFLTQVQDEGLPGKTLDKAALERLKDYRWPGNVRELENLIRRFAALYSEDMIGEEIVSKELTQTRFQTGAPMLNGAGEDPQTLAEAIEHHLRHHFEEFGEQLPPPGLYDRVLREMELPLIALSLRATRGNQIKASQMLGLNRNTLRKKIRELDIEVVRGIA
ncbi:MAG: nitrogen regulation protein NR(I), partial [Pseudomonadota bacterium]